MVMVTITMMIEVMFDNNGMLITMVIIIIIMIVRIYMLIMIDIGDNDGDMTESIITLVTRVIMVGQ